MQVVILFKKNFLLVGFAPITTPTVQCLKTTNIYLLRTWHGWGWGSFAMALLPVLSAEGKVRQRHVLTLKASWTVCVCCLHSQLFGGGLTPIGRSVHHSHKRYCTPQRAGYSSISEKQMWDQYTNPPQWWLHSISLYTSEGENWCFVKSNLTYIIDPRNICK